MMVALSPNLLAASTRTYFDFARLHSMTQWWHWMLLIGICAVVVCWVAVVHYFDSRELPQGKRWLLLTLRVATFAGLLFFFLDLEKRTERKLIRNSRAVVLVDTSLSMALPADPLFPDQSMSRIAQVVEAFADGALLTELRKKHDVTIYRFDEGTTPVEIASLSKTSQDTGATTTLSRPKTTDREQVSEAQRLIVGALAFLAISVISGLVHLGTAWINRGPESQSWGLLICVLGLITTVVIVAVANLRNPGVRLAHVLGQEAAASVINDTADVSDQRQNDGDPEVDWKSQLIPRGGETRLTDAISWILTKERGGPLAGITVLTDGRDTSGLQPEGFFGQATTKQIPVFPIGLGSGQRQVNVRVVDLETPPRVYPGDDFQATGYLQAYGLEGRMVEVQLFSYTDEGATEQREELLEQSQRMRLLADGEIQTFQVKLAPGNDGKRIYSLRVTPPTQDSNPADDAISTKVQIVDRKNRVLLLAGGPTREFRFVRNHLYRDPNTTVDVMLQGAQDGIAQEADQILYEFPSSADELFEYDCVVVFDPDWTALSEDNVERLERWVAEKAGGLIAVAGPVFTPKWSSQPRGNSTSDVVKSLYPVQFYSSSALRLGEFGSSSAWPLEFATNEQPNFLRLGDDEQENQNVWASFEGVYGYYSVRDLKPGATVYAKFSNPESAIDDRLPIYIAGQFFGSGRVVFLASGEMWRLRKLGSKYFEQFYTKLIRHVTQGRLLRDSSRGVLIVDKERCLLGDQITVRATLTDLQHRPLSIPSVRASVTPPDGHRYPIELRLLKQESRDGTYVGQFNANQKGPYDVMLSLTDGDQDELLTAEVRARVPDLEIELPERHDALLGQLAQKTGGTYFVGLPAALGMQGIPALAKQLIPKDQETYLPGTPDKEFDRQLMAWLLSLICGVLCLEWLIRRLSKLA